MRAISKPTTKPTARANAFDPDAASKETIVRTCELLASLWPVIETHGIATVAEVMRALDPTGAEEWFIAAIERAFARPEG